MDPMDPMDPMDFGSLFINDPQWIGGSAGEFSIDFPRELPVWGRFSQNLDLEGIFDFHMGMGRTWATQ